MNFFYVYLLTSKNTKSRDNEIVAFVCLVSIIAKMIGAQYSRLLYTQIFQATSFLASHVKKILCEINST